MKTAIILAILCSVAGAADLKLRNGKVLIDYQVVKVYPDRLSVAHRVGIIRILAEDLPPELEAKYKFDPAKVKEYREQKAARVKPPEELKPEDPPRPTLRVESASYRWEGDRVELSEALVKELNDLLEKCPRAQITRRMLSETVHFGVPAKRIDCRTSGQPFVLLVVGDSFVWRVVPVELRHRVQEFCGKLDQLESKSKAPAGTKKRKA